jgi:hypothetical protein
MRLLNPMEATTRPFPSATAVGAYDAFVAEGRLTLALETVSDQPPGCAAEAALRLALAEPLLAAIEAWCGQGSHSAEAPEWQWRTGPAETPGHGATLRWAGVGVGARLTLPWALLRRLPPPLSHRVLQQAQWSPVAAELVLAALVPTDEERAALEPGGAVLLPASFEPDWLARLRAADEDGPGGSWVLDPVAGVAATCAASEDSATVHAGAQPPGVVWELRCVLPESVAPELMLGWRDEPLPVGLAQRVGLWQVGPTGAAAQCLAQGRLMPWGEGRALWIDAVQGERPVDIV